MQTKSCFSNKNWLDYYINNISMWSWFRGSLKKQNQRLVDSPVFLDYDSSVSVRGMYCTFSQCEVVTCRLVIGLVQRTHSLSEQGILFSCNTKQKAMIISVLQVQMATSPYCFQQGFQKSSFSTSHTWKVHFRPGGRF